MNTRSKSTSATLEKEETMSLQDVLEAVNGINGQLKKLLTTLRVK